MLLLCGGIIFVRIEQGQVKRSLLNKNHIKDQNVALEAKNEELTSIKKQLAADEEECVARARSLLTMVLILLMMLVVVVVLVLVMVLWLLLCVWVCVWVCVCKLLMTDVPRARP